MTQLPAIRAPRFWQIPFPSTSGTFATYTFSPSGRRSPSAAPRLANLQQNHFRFAKSLAIPAAAAIYNARLYEYATIYSTELESNAKKLTETQKALEESQRRTP